jgi:hypothetical protein
MNDQSKMLLDMLRCMLSIISRELQRATSRGFLYHIRRFNVCDFSEEGGAQDQAQYFCQKTMIKIFFTSIRLLVLNFPQKAPNSIKIISLIRCFPIYTVKRDELRGVRVCRVFQSTWTIQCVITAQRSLKT